MKTEIINTRVEPKLKRMAAAVLGSLGLSTTEAITLFLHQVVLSEGLPFEVKVPNKVTRKAIKNALAGKNLTHYATLEDAKRAFE
ncbi:MAG TPA: type II toxin-antitoxin system RelB/DinJ family antitoxin [Alphaproteobacteria bacterium]|nr:type II toxin-antitoxin system RelB/DinJ family antitoxin [Alphaproteobacteria bacterium]